MKNLDAEVFEIEKVPLSDREEEVLSLISQGFSTNDIADDLHISKDTVKTYRKNLFRKLGANNMAVLIRRSMEYGLI
jgi:DNA-binding NarL/FixJ family response regulator